MSVKEHTKLTVVNRAISSLCVILHKYICDNFISVYTYWMKIYIDQCKPKWAKTARARPTGFDITP